jgi:hypothetical protein
MERVVFVEKIVESCWEERVSIFVHEDACRVAEDIGKTEEVVLFAEGTRSCASRDVGNKTESNFLES